MCSGLIYHSDDWEMVGRVIAKYDLTVRMSDPHHLRDDEGGRRRSNDLGTIPLCRRHHNWIDTAQGQRWERTHYPSLKRFALEYGVRSGVVKDIHLAREISDDDLLLSAFLPETE